jgi:DNA-binding NarL/FixJ family response regulator
MAKERSGSVTLLVGEPGIGKTRLLNEFALSATRDGAIVLRGSAFEAEGMPPYLPFLEALGTYIRTTPWETLHEQIAHAPYTLLSIFPELATYLDDAPLSHSLPIEQARLRLYEAIGLFLENISTSQVLILMLDDLHWVDSGSLDLLYYVTRHHSNAKLLIIGAYRESELDHNPALNRTFAKLIRQRMLTTIAVDPLSHQEIEAIAENYLGDPVSAEISLLLYTQSEGNPFFAEELLRGWVETKAIIKNEEHWFTPFPLECTLPSNIIGVLRQRFALLSPETIRHLRVAAIIGRTFDLALLATVEEQEVESLEEQLIEAERAHLVHTEEGRIFTFNHDNIRACLYAEVSTSRRRRLHEAIGRILEARYERENTKSAYDLAAIAFHFAHSDDAERAAAYNQQAAEQALQSLATQTNNIRRIEFVERCQQLNAHPWLALLLSSQGSWDEAEQAVARAHPISSPESLSFLWSMRGFLAYQQEDYVTAEQSFMAARAIRQNTSSDFLLSTSLFSMTLVARRKYKEAAHMLDELEILLNEIEDNPLPIAPGVTCMALTATALGDLERMDRLYPRLLTFRGQHHLFLVDRVLGEICATRGDWEAAMIHLDEAEARARRGGLRPELARILLAKANCEVARGNAESQMRAASILTSAVSLFEELHLAEAAERVGSWLSTLAYDLRRVSSVRSEETAQSHLIHEISVTPQTLPGNLTRGEARVLQLVARGKSNRQIAQELGISEKTVANHLSHIFSKTTSGNRAAATAFAIRHGFA